MRLLLVADVDPTLVIGGAERLLAGHAAALAARGHDVVVCSAAPGPPGDRGGLRVIRAGRSPMGVLRSIEAVRRIRPHAVIGYQPASAIGPLRVAARRGVPSVYVFCSPWAVEHATRRLDPTRSALAVRRAVERACLRAADRVIVLSGYSEAQVRAEHPGMRLEVRRVPGGVDPARFSPNGGRGAARGRLGLPPSGTLLFTVRNLVPRMGLDNLVAAMPGVLRHHPEARLVIAGDGPLRPALDDQAARLGLGDRVVLPGFVPEHSLPDRYRAADVVVLPTRDLEGFGLTTVEALACGTPVVGTPVGATPEILAPLDRGLVAESPAPEAIATAIVRLLDRRPDDLGDRARRHVLATYTWDAVAAGLEAVIAEVAR